VLGGVPVFLGLTRPLDPRARNRAAYVGVLAATGVLAGFAAFGQAVIQYLSISLESLMVAGGVLLFIVALEMLRGGDSLTAANKQASMALVPLGTPLLRRILIACSPFGCWVGQQARIYGSAPPTSRPGLTRFGGLVGTHHGGSYSQVG
jgi:MarC family integral membrane protein